MTANLHLIARLSLSLLWIFTGITSLFIAKDVGLDILANGGITGPVASLITLLGSLLDGVIGIWLLLDWKMKSCYLVQMVVVTTYTLLLTVIDSSFWFHPFGPLTKNIPLLVMIYYLYSKE